jgi:hypothetical protein
MGLSSTSLAALTPGKVSCFLPPPPHNGAPPPPPPLHALSPPSAEESIDLSSLEHAASPGQCSNVGHFFYFVLLAAQHRATTTHDDVFPLRRAQSPSLTFNLVGRRLRSAKCVANTLPTSGRASVYCCLPCGPFAHKQTTSHFSARKIS